MTNIEWQISNLEYKVAVGDKSNVVMNIHWRCLGNDGTYTHQTNGIQQVTFDESADFVPYENLTESMVFGWLENELKESKTVIEESVKSKVEEQRTPKISFGLPWKA